MFVQKQSWVRIPPTNCGAPVTMRTHRRRSFRPLLILIACWSCPIVLSAHTHTASVYVCVCSPHHHPAQQEFISCSSSRPQRLNGTHNGTNRTVSIYVTLVSSRICCISSTSYRVLMDPAKNRDGNNLRQSLYGNNSSDATSYSCFSLF